MPISETLLPEFEEEMKTTRRLLERVPTDKGKWKPHEKSFSLGHLAQLVSWMPEWIGQTLRERERVLKPGGGYTYETTQTLLKTFDENVAKTREAIKASKDKDYDAEWSLKVADQTVWTAPRKQVVRTHLNHLIHHRGQLTVYLRLVDVPLPPIYGPTADERTPGL